MTRQRLSKHFDATEFDCRNGAQWPPAARAALELWCAAWGEPLREAFGPVRITSGYRTRGYNRAVGGAAQSYHRYDLRYGPEAMASLGKGLAADVVPSRGTPAAWGKWAAAHKVRLQRSGRRTAGTLLTRRLAAVPYPRDGFIHLDTGPDRTWAG